MRFVERRGSEPWNSEWEREYGALGVTPLLGRLLLARGVAPDQTDTFLHPRITDLHSPMLFSCMKAVRERVYRAVEQGEKIAVYSDYDADGTIGNAIITFALRQLGAKISAYIPDRFTEGYGTNPDAIRKIAAQGVKLLITVDCGIRSTADVRLAKELGMEVVILDHHECGDEIPDTPYLLNAKRPGETYPFRELCGAGVAFQLARALIGEKALSYLDLAAVATIGDIVSLKGENRTIAYLGMEKLRRDPCDGLLELSRQADIRLDSVTSYGISFGLVPRINAAGRMQHASIAYRMLVSRKAEERREMARRICALNDERQSCQRRIVTEAEKRVKESVFLSEDRVIMIYGENWELGVVGLAASKIAETYYRPTIVLSLRDGILTGSGRSIPGVNLYEALSSVEKHFIRFGGHEQAAGLTFAMSEWDSVYQGLKQYFAQHYSDEAFLRRVEYDEAVALSTVTTEQVEQLRQLEPFGMDNPEPVFLAERETVCRQSRMGKEGQHLKLHLTGSQVEAVAFFAQQPVAEGDTVSLLGALSVNEFRGTRTAQLVIREMVRSDADARTVLRSEMQHFPSEVCGFRRFLSEKDGLLVYDDAEKWKEELRRAWRRPIGNIAFSNTQFGLSRLEDTLREMEYRSVSGTLSQYTAENTLCCPVSRTAGLENFSKIWVMGAYALLLRPGFWQERHKAAFYYDAEIHRAYQIEAMQYYIEGEQISLANEVVRRILREDREYERMSDLLEIMVEQSGGQLTLKQAWYALNVFFEQKLLERIKSDKIHIIYRGQVEFSEHSETQTAFAGLVESELDA